LTERLRCNVQREAIPTTEAAGETSKPGSLLNKVAVDKNSDTLRPKGREHPGPLLLDDNVMSVDGAFHRLCCVGEK